MQGATAAAVFLTTRGARDGTYAQALLSHCPERRRSPRPWPTVTAAGRHRRRRRRPKHRRFRQAAALRRGWQALSKIPTSSNVERPAGRVCSRVASKRCACAWLSSRSTGRGARSVPARWVRWVSGRDARSVGWLRLAGWGQACCGCDRLGRSTGRTRGAGWWWRSRRCRGCRRSGRGSGCRQWC